MSRILVLSLEPGNRIEEILRCLEDSGEDLRVIGSEAELAELLDCGCEDPAVLTGDGAFGSECLRIAGALREAGHTCPLVWWTEGVSLALAVAAMRAGISDIVQTSDG